MKRPAICSRSAQSLSAAVTVGLAFAVIQTKNLLLPCFVIHSLGGGNEHPADRDRALCHAVKAPHGLRRADIFTPLDSALTGRVQSLRTC
ncbi:hypothetical protein BSZ22_20480 [Bradyrhizobium canariense]|uniref:Uncharacterized protein n=1 Tax=Bradyrhizobium canariense TaxID=255045 RepID=A0A1X3H2Z2_9BRAD|nr:hypothetical protein BSZ22_20480 [Bradyrhizobium canariense]OSI78004.1 hypothetical protein BSZ23_19480 [Bradyrhizobium canariense]OSI89233.1 hypothetical protein BSZ25_20950 [Bradyrhizobium canariense]OSI93716.1 hypothetical protein BSZ24_12180 [Bradyrhizobium canariense]OSJ03032.1 hypothetical protein BSZ16_16375 [Bradyrhizobium canariense]